MASAEYRVLTPERVSLEYDIAGVGSRGAAALVDTAIQAAGLIVVVVALSAVLAAGGSVLDRLGSSQVLSSVVFGLFALAIFAMTNGYFMLFEIVWSGQTPGKRLVGVRVMRENGYPIRPIDAVIRNLVRIVDWLPLGYGIGVLTMLSNTRSKRLGDFASGTIVVREGQRAFSAAAMPEVSPRGEAARVTLAASDATLVRDFLLRRGGMHPRSRADLAQRLATALAHRYGLPADADADAEGLLERLAQ